MVDRLATLSDAVSTIALSALTLVAVLVVTVGVWRAWVDRRRPQVVVEDVVAGAGLSTDDLASSSVAFRQMLRRAVRTQTTEARAAVKDTLRTDVEAGLLHTGGGLDVATLAQTLEKSTRDALAPLTSGMQALAPERSEGLVAALGALLPTQRGWQVRVVVVRAVDGPGPRVGLSVEVGAIGRSADDTETFWVSMDEPPGARGDDSRSVALVERLLVPATVWTAIRLVSHQLEVARTARAAPRSGLTSREVSGLRRQLAGQLALYASRDHRAWARPLARQALEDLDTAQDRIPGYARPPQTAAECRERIGWSYRNEGDLVLAAKEFARAVERWDTATDAVGTRAALAPEEREVRLDRIRVRRTKCLLLSDHPARTSLSGEDLLALGRTERSWNDLYNAACLFALASAQGHLAATATTVRDLAWQHLTLSLLASGRGGLHEHCVVDEELSALTPVARRALVDHLRRVNPRLEQITGPRAEAMTTDALSVVRAAGPRPKQRGAPPTTAGPAAPPRT